MVAIALAAKRNVKKKTDDLIDVWQPPLPNIGKVEVIYSYDTVDGTKKEHFEIERYKSLVIRPTITYKGTVYRFKRLLINDIRSAATPMLFLDENVSTVFITYVTLSDFDFGGVVEENISGKVSLENYLPQLGNVILGKKTIPRGIVYEGVIFEGASVNIFAFAFPVDLDKKDFKVEVDSVIFTLRLNRRNKIKYGDFRLCLFDVIKAQFGEGLPYLHSESFVELKPKGD